MKFYIKILNLSKSSNLIAFDVDRCSYIVTEQRNDKNIQAN